MEFERFPTFLGNERASGLEIGSFAVVSKTFVMKRIYRKEAFFCGRFGNGLNGYNV
jgi:hypothetical protein